MSLTQLDSENADRDLTSSVTILTHTPSVTEHRQCQAFIAFGDGVKDLDGTGGDFEVVTTVGGQTIEPSPQTVTFSTAVRTAVWTNPFPVPANREVVIQAKSPNAGDSDVDVTAYLFEDAIGIDWANDGRLDLLIDTIYTVTNNILTQVADIYHADIELTIDDSNSQDEYTIRWFKNGSRITSGITVPQIQVTKRTDGTDLIPQTSMSEIDSTGAQKYDEATNRITEGEAVEVIITATIDSSTRTWSDIVFRDYK